MPIRAGLQEESGKSDLLEIEKFRLVFCSFRCISPAPENVREPIVKVRVHVGAATRKLPEKTPCTFHTPPRSGIYIIDTVIQGGLHLKGVVEERAVELGEYILEHKATVRSTAKMFGVSKSTVHMVVT